MKFVDRRHVTLSHQRFFKFKNLKKLTRKHSRRNGKWLVWWFCLTLWMKYWRCTVGFFSVQIHWEVMSNLSFLGLSRSSKLFIISQRIWIEKNPTVHLPYFIHRVRQNCQTNHFPFLDERFFVSFFKFLNLKNRWCDEVPWLWWSHMTSVNEFHERSPRRMCGQNFTSLQGVEGA